MSKRVEDVREMRLRDEILRDEDAREARIYNTAIIVMLALTALYYCWLGWMKARQPVVERAAYLEGRYGLDHDTAISQPHRGARRIAETPEAKDPPHGAVRKG